MQPLPRIMVAPNGARLKKTDHPAIPVTIPEIVETAQACLAAGADGIHAHIRNEHGEHVLDAGIYRELLGELVRTVPAMYHQITTEAVGRYSPGQQIALVRDLKPKAVSIALRECSADYGDQQLADFYAECVSQNVDVQHILYAADELDCLVRVMNIAGLSLPDTKVLFVLGRYTKDQQSGMDDLTPFLQRLHAMGHEMDWAVCAFGINETGILRNVLENGGKARIGFENNLLNDDGLIASSNQERVAQLLAPPNV